MDQYQVSWINTRFHRSMPGFMDLFLGDSDFFLCWGGDLSLYSLYSLPNNNLADFCVFLDEIGNEKGVSLKDTVT